MRVQARRPVILESQPKSSDNAGGHRSLPPQRVYDRYKHLISPVTGVIKEITQHERGPSFFNSFRAGNNVAVSRNLFSPHAAPRAENGGHWSSTYLMVGQLSPQPIDVPSRNSSPVGESLLLTSAPRAARCRP